MCRSLDAMAKLNRACNNVWDGLLLNSHRTAFSIFALLCLFFATSSHAVKCIQAGYTVDEGAIECIPSVLTETTFTAYAAFPRISLGPFSTFAEAANAMKSTLAGAPYCGVTSGGGPIIDGSWGDIGGGVTLRISQNGDIVTQEGFFWTVYDSDTGSECHYDGKTGWMVRRVERALCEPGHEIYDWFYKAEGGDNTMVCGDTSPAKECKQGNPVDIFTGNKLQHERHITGYGTNGLSFGWYYSAQRKPVHIYMGPSISEAPLLSVERPVWMHEYAKRLYFNNNGIRPVIERVTPADSRSLFLIQMGENNWVDALGVIFPDLQERPEEPVERWKYTTPDGKSEFYDPQGRLVKELDSQGRAVSMSYVDGLVVQVRNWKGHTLDFAYDTNGVLEHVTDSTDHIYRYQFNSEGLLTRVTFPDETPANDTDNPTRRYLYEYDAIPHALTSIIDENNEVAANWSYDGSGRAISSSHAGGADMTTFNYGDNSTTVTNALGKETTYHYSTIQNIYGVVFRNVNMIDRVEGHPSTHCAGANTDYEYNYDGYITEKVDWNENVTTYTRDSEGRELSRSEAAGTSESRTIFTDWDTALNKPLVVTEPNRITEYNYDSEGRLLGKVQREPDQ